MLSSDGVRAQNILYPPAARLSTKHSHYFSKPFAIGDAVHFQESTQPFIFLGYTGKVTYDDVGQEEYEAEFRAPYRTNPPTSIRLNLHRKAAKDCIRLAPPRILSWEWTKEKLRSYFCW
jgi:hypothetical protein